MRMPVPGITTFDPNAVLIVAVQETQFPSASATQKWVVCFSKKLFCQSGGVPCSTGVAFFESIFAASSLA